MALSKLLIKVLEPKRTKKLEETLKDIDFSKINSLEELQKIQEDIYDGDDILPEDNDHSMFRGGIIGGLPILPLMASLCYHDISQNPDSLISTLGRYGIMTPLLMILWGGIP